MYKLLLFFVFLFVVVNVADAITCLYILPAESNPIYLFTHSIFILMILKVLLMIGVCYIFVNIDKLKSDFSKYAYILCLVLGTYTVCIGVYSNVIGILNPQLVEQSMHISVSEKISYYKSFMLFLYIIPYLLSAIAFIVWRSVTKKEKIENGKI
jgi:hypothetical protein